MKKLYVVIVDHETNTRDYLSLVPFGDNGDYMKITVHHNMPCMEVHVDDGYVVTTYYYPTPRYAIESIAKW